MIAYLGSLKPFIAPPPVAPYDLDYVVVAGGGGGGGAYQGDYFGNGGGGAGGYLSGTLTAQTVSVYNIYIGAGGIGRNASASRGGSNTIFQSSNSTVFCIGGGSNTPRNGGSGAGAWYNNAVGLGTAGQGNNGGGGPGSGQVGGGGGAGEAGATGSTTAKGGDGLTWVDGITRAGGGGGNRNSPDSLSGLGGAGGGGRGAINSIVAGAGVANTGGGGGCGWPLVSYEAGGNGGSGVVKVRYFGTPRATGGIIIEDGGYTYHEFTSSGRLIFTS